MYLLLRAILTHYAASQEVPIFEEACFQHGEAARCWIYHYVTWIRETLPEAQPAVLRASCASHLDARCVPPTHPVCHATSKRLLHAEVSSARLLSTHFFSWYGSPYRAALVPRDEVNHFEISSLTPSYETGEKTGICPSTGTSVRSAFKTAGVYHEQTHLSYSSSICGTQSACLASAPLFVPV